MWEIWRESCGIFLAHKTKAPNIRENLGAFFVRKFVPQNNPLVPTSFCESAEAAHTALSMIPPPILILTCVGERKCTRERTLQNNLWTSPQLRSIFGFGQGKLSDNARVWCPFLSPSSFHTPQLDCSSPCMRPPYVSSTPATLSNLFVGHPRTTVEECKQDREGYEREHLSSHIILTVLGVNAKFSPKPEVLSTHACEQQTLHEPKSV